LTKETDRERMIARLPATNNERWTFSRKAAVVAAVAGGAITFGEAARRYRLSAEEFLAWQREVEVRQARHRDAAQRRRGEH
jgi:transposase-like protein